MSMSIVTRWIEVKKKLKNVSQDIQLIFNGIASNIKLATGQVITEYQLMGITWRIHTNPPFIDITTHWTGSITHYEELYLKLDEIKYLDIENECLKQLSK